MDRHHGHTKPRCFDSGVRDRVRNIVKLEIEKNVTASGNDLLHNGLPCGHEQLASDLEHSDQVMKLLHQLKRFFTRAHIQRNNDFSIHCFICPIRSRGDDRFFFFRNFSSPSRTCNGAFGS